ncbi:MAG: (2Fe-2S)-binding protein [Chloroflexota bacterium]|nr:MAG: (2Fe-2S)-binding protein [Chloroflexota bacterium]
MADEVTLSIDGHVVQVPAGTTILKAAEQLGEKVPTICYHDHTTANGLCRLCVVEVAGARVLSPACTAEVREGMQVSTRSERVERSRRTLLEMLSSAVDLSEAAEIQTMMEEYTANPDRFPEGQTRSQPILDDNPMFIRDYAKCVMCWRCVQVCADDAQYTHAINFTSRGFDTMIGTFFDKPLMETTCVFCGQCVGVCPSGALKAKRQYLLERGLTPDEVMGATRSERRRKKRSK